jgi:subtilase family serine protease
VSFTIQRFLGIAPVMILGLLLLTPAPGLAQVAKPDLVVNSLVSQAGNDVLPGDSFVVTATIKNTGTGAAGASVTKFFLVPAIGLRKNLLGLQNVDPLGPGISGAPPVTVTIFSDTIPGPYSLQACADAGETVGEVSESNNCRIATGTITINALPDLVMKMMSEPPLQVLQGQGFEATYKVKNTAPVSAPASVVKFSLVPTVVGAKTGIDLKIEDSPEDVGSLGPGATFANTLPLTVRAETVPGTYRMKACVKFANPLDPNAVDGDDNDNCKTSLGTVEVTPQYDLLVKKVSVPGVLTVDQGDSLTINLVLRNDGLLDAPASTLKLRLVSTVGTPPPQESLGTVAVPAVPTGGKVNLVATPIVDEETAPGSYIVQACANYVPTPPKIVDGSKKNDCATSLEVVTVTGLPLSLADLAVTALTPPPATRLPGETFSLTATVKNNGTGASPATTTKFNLVNALVNPTTTKNLKGVQLVDPLAAGATNATEVTVEVYGDTVPGTYFLQACADGGRQIHEGNEGDNCRTSSSPITVSPVPDLVLTAIGNPPSTLEAGQNFPAATTYSVTNAGAVAAVPSTAKFSLVSTVVGAIPIALKGTVPADLALPALDPGQVFNHAASLKVRADTPPGSYRLLGCADSGKVVAETDEDDNCKQSATTVVVTGLPDLVSAVKLAQPVVTVLIGGTLPITVDVRNQGFANAAGSTVKLSLVVSPGAAPEKTLLESQAVPAVALSGQQTVQPTVTIPSGTTLGTYVVQACVDTGKLVPEMSDENNCGTSVDTIKVQ